MALTETLKGKLNRQYGTDPTEDAWHGLRVARLPKIRIYHDCEETRQKSEVDEITWNDLEMDSVFFRINHTRYFAGEQMLYRLLHNPQLTEEERENFTETVSLMDKNEPLRNSIESALCKAGQKEDDYYLPQFMEEPAAFGLDHPMLYKAGMCILPCALLAAILTGGKLAILLIVSVIFNLLIYLSARMKYDIVLSSIGSAGKLLNLCAGLAADKTLSEHIPENVKQDISAVSKLRKKIQTYSFLKKSAGTGDLTALLLDMVMGVTLIDLARMDGILSGMDKHKAAIMRMFRFAGMMDSAISVASYRRSIPYYCEPAVSGDAPFGSDEAAGDAVCGSRETARDACDFIKAVKLYHPLLHDPVSNDVTLRRRTMFTGANASGKSTFLKSIAINMILAQTIGTCTAEHFEAPKLQIMTSMAIRDDISTGESYYIREVKYLKRMLDVIDEGIPVLCIIDEILKGTNETERLAASEAVLTYMGKKKCFVMAASHDLQMVRSMADRYDNYHFESRMEDGTIVFDYILREGIGDGTNAIDLMKSFGFPEEVIENARRKAGK